MINMHISQNFKIKNVKDKFKLGNKKKLFRTLDKQVIPNVINLKVKFQF